LDDQDEAKDDDEQEPASRHQLIAVAEWLSRGKLAQAPAPASVPPKVSVEVADGLLSFCVRPGARGPRLGIDHDHAVQTRPLPAGSTHGTLKLCAPSEGWLRELAHAARAEPIRPCRVPV
jgi:hypothetical protein